jgi:hypothetical protein
LGADSGVGADSGRAPIPDSDSGVAPIPGGDRPDRAPVPNGDRPDH